MHNRLISEEDLIQKYSLPLPMYFQGVKGHKFIVHPYNYFESIHTLNYYAYAKGVLIFKSNGSYYITFHTDLFESVLKIYGYHRIFNFPGFDPHKFKPIDIEAREIWDKLLEEFS